MQPWSGTPPVQPSATASRLRIVPLQESLPRLRLETLTAHQVEFVLCITYASVILAAAIGLLERQAYVYDDVSISALPSWDSACTAGSTVHTACLGDNSTWWADGREFINATTTPLELSINYTNRFFKLHANLSTRTFGATKIHTFRSCHNNLQSNLTTAVCIRPQMVESTKHFLLLYRWWPTSPATARSINGGSL